MIGFYKTLEVKMGYVFFIITLLFSGINNYLLIFSEMGKIPYPFGYNIFAKFGHLAILVMSIWHLGWLFGIIFFGLYLLNLLDACITWIVKYALINKYISNNKEPELSIGIYNFFTFLVIVVIVLTIASFFSSKFGEFRYQIENGEYKFLIYFGITLVVGFILRVILMKNMGK
jgi:hypothetical protein